MILKERIFRFETAIYSNKIFSVVDSPIPERAPVITSSLTPTNSFLALRAIKKLELHGNFRRNQNSLGHLPFSKQ